MPPILRPMTLGEILDQTFRMYRKNFVLFVGIAAIPYLMIFAFQTVISVLSSAGAIGGGGMKNAIAGIVVAVIMMVIFLIATVSSMSATVTAVSFVHLEKPITIGEAYKPLRRSFWRIMGVVIGMSLAIGLGFVIFIIPGIILALKWALAVPVAVVEDAGLSVATSRSSDLTKGSKGRIFAVMFVVMVLIWVVSATVGIPLGIIAASSVRAGHVPLWFEGVNNSIGFISNSLLGPLMTIAISLIYFDERVRKEAFDLQVLMGNAEPSSAAGAAQS